MPYAIFDRYSGEKIGPDHETNLQAFQEAHARKFTQQGLIVEQVSALSKGMSIWLLIQNYEIKSFDLG